MSYAVALLGFVTLQRVAELIWGARNTARLLAAGGVEFGRKQYPAIVVLQSAWLAGLWYWGHARPVNLPFFILFVLLQCGRLWVLMNLGRHWTTRIIVLPKASLVASGPYRIMRHPNYIFVTAEMVVVPLALWMPIWAGLFLILNVLGLPIRIRTENEALAWATGVQGRPQA